MAFGLVLLVAGMFVARMKSQKWWMKGHRAVMLAGAALAVAGLLYGIYLIQASTGFHFRVLHSFVGLLAMLLTVLMAAIGILLPKIAKGWPGARAAHRWMGRATILLIVAAVLMGLVQAGIITLG